MFFIWYYAKPSTILFCKSLIIRENNFYWALPPWRFWWRVPQVLRFYRVCRGGKYCAWRSGCPLYLFLPYGQKKDAASILNAVCSAANVMLCLPRGRTGFQHLSFHQLTPSHYVRHPSLSREGKTSIYRIRGALSMEYLF
jgi:hypothetical protein